MLTITVPKLEMWDEKEERFKNEPPFKLQLEHSLISLSKWEAKFEKPFLTDAQKTQEEMIWYIYFMLIPPGVSLEKLSRLSIENLQEIHKYIDSKQTATTFPTDPIQRKNKRQKITAEVIYYWMYSYGIPDAWAERHLNQLFALIRVFSTYQSKQGPNKKRDRAEIAAWQRAENERRRALHNTRG